MLVNGTKSVNRPGSDSEFGKDAVADGMIDCLAYNSHVIHIEGEVSMGKG